jgi:hypothetical protein
MLAKDVPYTESQSYAILSEKFGHTEVVLREDVPHISFRSVGHHLFWLSVGSHVRMYATPPCLAE